MIADTIIEQILKGLHGEGDPFYELPGDDLLADSELPIMGPVTRLGTEEPEDRIELQSFHPETKQRTPEFIDKMTSTAKEQRLAEKTVEQITPGSSAHFAAVQAATMPSEKRWFKQNNGKIDTAMMTRIEKGTHYMKPTAAKAYKAMQRAAKKDGIDFLVTDSYRTYAQQVALKAAKPTLAATPGKSNHGWGIALDINVNDPKVYNWLKEHGKEFGFEQPMSYEPWHWEYEGGYKGTSGGKKKTTKRVRVGSTAPQQTDVMTLMKATSASVIGPLSFMSVLGEVQEPKPQTRRQYESHKKAEGLAFVPQKYRSYFRAAAEKYGLSARLLASVAQVESTFNPDAVSSAGAQGLMQIMPLHGLEDPFSPKKNIFKGAEILASYMQGLGLRKGLAAYNAGPSNFEAGLDYADKVLAILRGGK